MSALAELKNIHRRSRRFLRALQGRDTFATSELQCEKLHLGRERAEWCLCPSGLSSKSVLYSFGVGEDASFELELIDRFGLEVHAFDPTPRSIEWVSGRAWPEQFIFHDYGVADFDGTEQFRPPANPRFVSYTAVRGNPSVAICAPVYSLTTTLQRLGHSAIDVLKMDIEGMEYRVLHNMLNSAIRPRQLLIEFHHRWPEIGAARTQRALVLLKAADYRIFHVSPSGEEFSLILQ
jgi:FkbM family methyltransferase